MHIDRYRKSDLYKCPRCTFCGGWYLDEVCQVRRKFGFNSYFALGRLRNTVAILDGLAEYNQDLADRLFYCFLCGKCKEKCIGIDTPEITKDMRADVTELGFEIPEGVKKLVEAVEKTHNIFGASPQERGEWVEGKKPPKKGDVLYFVGCMASYRLPEIPQATAKILEASGIKYAYLDEEEWCCGNPLFLLGQYDLAREVARRNLERFRETGAKTLLTACPGCFRAFNQEYPKVLGEKLPLEVKHSTQFFLDLIKQKKLPSFKEIKETVVWHDPCDLGRHSKVYLPPRKILASIPGITLVEAEKNRADTLCCGGGGGVKAAHPEVSVEIGTWKLRDDFIPTGAKTIVSGCPSCKWNITDAIEAAKSDLKIIDITELLAEAIG